MRLHEKLLLSARRCLSLSLHLRLHLRRRHTLGLHLLRMLAQTKSYRWTPLSMMSWVGLRTARRAQLRTLRCWRRLLQLSTARCKVFAVVA